MSTSISTSMFEFADSVIARFNRCSAVEFLLNGKMTVCHYAEILRQFHHYTKENPGLQALAATRLRGDDRKLVRKMFLHATAEVGHDQLALQDLATLGFEVRSVPYQNPLPSTMQLIAFPYYQIHNRNPIGYLGCILFLERLPVKAGGAYIAQLERAGVPQAAMTFIADHASIDVQHNKLMVEYLDSLIRSPEDAASVRYCLEAMSFYYANMLWGAIQQVEVPHNWDIDFEEKAKAFSGGAE